MIEGYRVASKYKSIEPPFTNKGPIVAGRRLSPSEWYLTELALGSNIFTVDQLYGAISIPMFKIYYYLDQLVQKGVLEEVD